MDNGIMRGKFIGIKEKSSNAKDCPSNGGAISVLLKINENKEYEMRVYLK